ncbi:MAG: hypothetical protein V1694_01060 [Candidatus Eisenbacteria bacterium]
MKRFVMVVCVSLCVLGLPHLAYSGETLLLEDAWSPSWSPDGTALVCNRPTPTYEDQDIQIWMVSAGGGDPDTLFVDPNGAFGPMWHPDGRHIVYHRFREGDELPQVYEFVVYDLDGGPSVVWQVPEFWDDPGFSLTPDGEEVLYTVWDPVDHEIWALNLSSGTTRFLRHGTGGVISPDGQWLAFFTQNDSLAVEPIRGGETRLFETGSFARWTPDSEKIIFTGWSMASNPELVVVSRDGAYREELTSDPDCNWGCAVSPQGDKVAYTKSPRCDDLPLDIWILELPSTATEQTTWGQIKALWK